MSSLPRAARANGAARDGGPGAWGRRGASSPDALEALLGRPRSAILTVLDRPLRAGELAERLGQVPSGVTHHLAVLESAGLVTRERRGQSVLVRRTARGTALLNLLRSP